MRVVRTRKGSEVKTVREAFREFWSNRSPWVLLVGIELALLARVLVGDWTWRDGVAAASMLVIYPFGEWAIHVYLLHLKPFSFRGRRVDLVTARAHREHHEAPNDLGLILLAPREAMALLLLAVPVAVGLFAVPLRLASGAAPIGALITGAFVGYLLIGVYEWTHFLIHTAVRPRSRYYRSVWRNHRLHHFKNEHFWHGITNTVADRAFRTKPDHHSIRRSPTARTLQH
jgi:hypothetical protein